MFVMVQAKNPLGMSMIKDHSMISGATSPLLPPKYQEHTVLNPDVLTFEKVTDWKKRIDQYTQFQKNKYAIAFAKEKEFFQVLNDKSKEWSETINNKKTGLICEQKVSKGGMNCIRVTCPSDFDAWTSFRAASNTDLRLKYDKQIQTMK